MRTLKSNLLASSLSSWKAAQVDALDGLCTLDMCIYWYRISQELQYMACRMSPDCDHCCRLLNRGTIRESRQGSVSVACCRAHGVHKMSSIGTRSNNLPVQLTRFIGHEREIAEVKRRLSIARLVTLTGAGGSGKTR